MPRADRPQHGDPRRGKGPHRSISLWCGSPFLRRGLPCMHLFGGPSTSRGLQATDHPVINVASGPGPEGPSSILIEARTFLRQSRTHVPCNAWSGPFVKTPAQMVA